MPRLYTTTVDITREGFIPSGAVGFPFVSKVVWKDSIFEGGASTTVFFAPNVNPLTKFDLLPAEDYALLAMRGTTSPVNQRYRLEVRVGESPQANKASDNSSAEPGTFQVSRPLYWVFARLKVNGKTERVCLRGTDDRFLLALTQRRNWGVVPTSTAIDAVLGSRGLAPAEKRPAAASALQVPKQFWQYGETDWEFINAAVGHEGAFGPDSYFWFDSTAVTPAGAYRAVLGSPTADLGQAPARTYVIGANGNAYATIVANGLPVLDKGGGHVYGTGYDIRLGKFVRAYTGTTQAARLNTGGPSLAFPERPTPTEPPMLVRTHMGIEGSFDEIEGLTANLWGQAAHRLYAIRLHLPYGDMLLPLGSTVEVVPNATYDRSPQVVMATGRWVVYEADHTITRGAVKTSLLLMRRGVYAGPYRSLTVSATASALSSNPPGLSADQLASVTKVPTSGT